jgi:hypothetical protein
MDTTRIEMGSPADLRLHSEAPLRLFTVTEADALVPQLELTFRRLDPKLARLRELRELVEDAESYFGEGLVGAPPKDRDAYAVSLQEQSDLERSVQADVDEVHALGCELKDVHRGLVDFPARIGDEVAYLCWQRGEPRIGWWHTLEAGFAGRKALTPEVGSVK